MPETSIAKLEELAYLHWCERGRPLDDDWADWFWAERSLAAYFRWLNRGGPIGDDWADWFWAERSLAAYFRWLSRGGPFGDEWADWFAVLWENTRKLYAPTPNRWDAQGPAIGRIP